VDLTPLAERLDSADETKRTTDAAFSEALESVRASLEEKIAAIPPPPPPEPVDLAPLAESVEALQARHAEAEERAATERTEVRIYVSDLLKPMAAAHAAEEASRKAVAERIASLTPALRDVIENEVRRIVRVEADRARRAAQSPEKLRAWMETFYLGREDAWVVSLLPTMRLHFQLVGRADEAEAETRRIVHAHVEASRTSLETVAADADTLEANVKALTAHWEAERPKAVADECVREVIANHV
jgi:hypothetical protein